MSEITNKVEFYSSLLSEIDKLTEWMRENSEILPFSGSKVGPTRVVTLSTYTYGEQKLREGIANLIRGCSEPIPECPPVNYFNELV